MWHLFKRSNLAEKFAVQVFHILPLNTHQHVLFWPAINKLRAWISGFSTGFGPDFFQRSDSRRGKSLYSRKFKNRQDCFAAQKHLCLFSDKFWRGSNSYFKKLRYLSKTETYIYIQKTQKTIMSFKCYIMYMKVIRWRNKHLALEDLSKKWSISHFAL